METVPAKRSIPSRVNEKLAELGGNWRRFDLAKKQDNDKKA